MARAPYDRIDAKITRIPLRYPAPRGWWIAFAAASALFGLYLVAAGVLFWKGVGVWGIDIPVNWGLAITNYIWWLGIGHAGTLISAMLLLLGQSWRNSLNRFAEAMTLFAVVCAGMYPILHLGRPERVFWMAPYPSTLGVWPQFRSPLAWDFFAVATYLIVSVLFWYIGAIPDFAATRDASKSRPAQLFYGLISLGWRGASRHWLRWNQAYRLSAAIAVPLVVSVHSEISLLLAGGPMPGWNSTVFPPYFVFGAAFSGFAVVSMIATVLRQAFALQNLVTPRHLDLLGQLTLLTGLMTAYGYVSEVFTTLYGHDKGELLVLHNRLTGGYAWSYWGAWFFNFAPLQLLWIKRFRVNPLALFLIGLSAATGMWMERFMLLVTTLYQTGLVSSFFGYTPSVWEWTQYIGSIGLFMTPFLLFVRFLPMISAFEINEARDEGKTVDEA